MANSEMQEILTLLKHGKNLILQGAPGTGKTWIVPEIVTRLCGAPEELLTNRNDVMTKYRQLVNDRRVRFVTFHPSLDYEDFIEGWKPGETKEEDPAEDGDAVKYSEGLSLHVR